MSRTYRLELTGSDVPEPLELDAEDDDAARLQALRMAGELVHDCAIRGETAVAFGLRLTSPEDRLLYRATIAFDPAA